MDVEKEASVQSAKLAITSLGDSGVALRFNRGALGCRTLRALAELVVESMAAFDIECHVQLRTPFEVLTLTPHGPATPLELSVIELSQTMDRIFSFQNRVIVNYDDVSLLVTNMPIKDEALCGRIRDQLATIAEVAELAVGNINLRTDAIVRAEELSVLADASRHAVEGLRVNYRNLQLATRIEFENMTDSIEGMYVHLALSNHQEFTISDTVRSSVDRVLKLFESSTELDRSFAGIIAGLTKASEYKITQEDEPQLMIELF
jgi:hypothetical protein